MKKIILPFLFLTSSLFCDDFVPMNVPDGATDLAFPPTRTIEFDTFNFKENFQAIGTFKDYHVKNEEFRKNTDNSFHIEFSSFEAIEGLKIENQKLKDKISDLEARIARLEQTLK